VNDTEVIVKPRSAHSLTLHVPRDRIVVRVRSCDLLEADSLAVRHVKAIGMKYPAGHAIYFEARHFPDSPNHPNFPSAEITRPTRCMG
jgi:hypothetical protein